MAEQSDRVAGEVGYIKGRVEAHDADFSRLRKTLADMETRVDQLERRDQRRNGAFWMVTTAAVVLAGAVAMANGLLSTLKGLGK